MAVTTRHQISLYEEAKTGLHSLVKQTAQVGAGFLIMLLVTGGKPPALTLTLSCIAGIGFVAWSEEKRITKQRVMAKNFVTKEEIPEQFKRLLKTETNNFLELVKSAELNPSEDLVGADLTKTKATGCNFRGFNFSGANFSEADWSRADLSNTNLSRANLRSAKLSRVNLAGADLSNALLIDTDLSHADIKNANLSSADLINVDLSSADLSGVNLTKTNLSSAIVINAQFGSNAGLTDDEKSDLKNRGARFPENELASVQF
ncbi:pentapeptide repeat-containing protein [Desmonostoc muscorum LEGE 12446]|uniref:Pentapeptide repeat-containing protein n=1 Tax=Desmonostoc muscorum LEGE 12446 TaxID=1828758 RepID=A0A8J6ZZ76_DESMC|nr:pentapeptide repeat-containing protein [Desmonostoc muscorum]MCF2150364.1 pentapeptide repeat-containing protein [Desmonostoc muscorum LEGE 12446]